MHPRPCAGSSSPWARARYRGFGVDGGVEGALQAGHLDADTPTSQLAYALHGDVAYGLGVPTSPSLGVEVNDGSGDSAGTDGQSERFLNLFPTNYLFYGYMDLQNWSSALNGAAHLKLALWRGVGIALSYWVLARATADDGWTGAGGATRLAADPDGAHGDALLLGHELDATLSFKVSAHLQWQAGLSAFVPAGFTFDKGPDPQLWGSSMLSVGF